MGARGDAALAREVAEAAGRLLLQVKHSGLLSGLRLGACGDMIANSFIMTALREARPDDGFLSEEEKDDLARLAQRRVWIVDPLDGTREYSDGRADWAVHVALAVDGEAALGAVALPESGDVFSSAEPRPLPEAGQPLRMVVSRTRPPAVAPQVAEAMGARLLTLGSAGAKAMAVVKGEADIYLHSGGMAEWDSCAPVAVALAAGLHVSRLDGSPLRYNKQDLELPDLLICRRELASECLELMR